MPSVDLLFEAQQLDLTWAGVTDPERTRRATLEEDQIVQFHRNLKVSHAVHAQSPVVLHVGWLLLEELAQSGGTARRPIAGADGVS